LAADRLDAEEIFAGASGRRLIGREGKVFGVVESTMETARRLAAGGAPDGYVVLAERQRAGRARTGRWECPGGQGILMSVVLRLGVSATERKLIVLLGAVSAAEAAQGLAPEVRIKWPNDIVLARKAGGLEIRKLGGVLVEQVPQGDAAPAHVLGVGLNVNQDRRRLPAGTPTPCTSLKIELGGRHVDRGALCRSLLERLDFWYRKLQRGQREALLARWRALSCLIDERVRVSVDGRVLEGRVLGLRATGELVLKVPQGREILLTSERASVLADGRPP